MPSLRAFWRSDPSVRFVIFASLATEVFAFECARSSFTSSFVYSRRTIRFLVFLAIDVSRTLRQPSSTSNVLGNLMVITLITLIVNGVSAIESVALARNHADQQPPTGSRPEQSRLHSESRQIQTRVFVAVA
jgi:hypothetical protein